MNDDTKDRTRSSGQTMAVTDNGHAICLTCDCLLMIEHLEAGQ